MTFAALSRVLAVSLLAVACSVGGRVVGSGDLVTKSYDFTDFRRLDVHHDFEVEIKRGDAYEVR